MIDHLEADLLTWLLTLAGGASLYVAIHPVHIFQVPDRGHTIPVALALVALLTSLTLAFERPNGAVVFSIGLIVATLTSMVRWCVECVRLWVQSR